MCEICFESLKILTCKIISIKIITRYATSLTLYVCDDGQALRQIINSYEINLFYIFMLSCFFKGNETYFPNN